MSTVPQTALNANQTLSLSVQGQADLMQREGVIRHYYDDAVNNCTYGVGTLAHAGPCSPQELSISLSDKQVVASMQSGIEVAEGAIYRNVTRYPLTQKQFDALVSFTYNVGSGGAQDVLRLINQGQLAKAVNLMMLYVHATVY